LYWADQSNQGRIKVSCTGMKTEEPNEATKGVTLSFVLFESPFTSVSTVSHSSLVSLDVINALAVFLPMTLYILSEVYP
jgi:hypothetical protein